MPTATWADIPLASVDVGNVGVAGSATEANGVWTITASGSDIWRDTDSFHFLYTETFLSAGTMTVQVNDLTDTNMFAKSGLMLRTSLDPGAATFIADAKPNGEVEVMSRQNDGEFMVYRSGVAARMPIWLRLVWISYNGGYVSVAASQDLVQWQSLGSVPFPFAAAVSNGIYAGIAVTSHDNQVLTTSHVQGFSLLNFGLPPAAVSTAIGTSKPGSVLYSVEPDNQVVTVEGAGSDVWGTADSFQFAYALLQPDNTLMYRVVSLQDTHPLAKAGVMIREWLDDSLEPGAPSVILDAKPSGEIEFMARLCYGCETTYLGGTTITFPAYLRLTRSSGTFVADVSQDLSSFTRVGTVDVSMQEYVLAGFAVTSHDPSRVTTAVFDLPRR